MAAVSTCSCKCDGPARLAPACLVLGRPFGYGLRGTGCDATEQRFGEKNQRLLAGERNMHMTAPLCFEGHLPESTS